MRIVTWNCNMAFRKKYKIICEEYSPDVILIQECEEPAKLEGLKNSYNILWLGDNKHKGLATLINRKYEFQHIDINVGKVRYVLGAKVGKLNILNFWAMNDIENVQHRYIAQVWLGLHEYKDIIGENTIIAGDFNWNMIWDKKPKYPLYGDLSMIISFLRDRKIQSAYHFISKEDFGEENQGTFYFRREKVREFHTDYIFASQSILDKIKDFKIGLYNKWTQYSDHMPLVLEY